MSMSCMWLMSITRSPATAQPAIPYPPDLTEGERPCSRQNLTIVLTSSASNGETAKRARGMSFPLNVFVRSMKLASAATFVVNM